MKRISVTQDDINKAERCGAKNCPIALAMSREFEGLASVGLYDYGVTIGERYVRGPLPDEAKAFVLTFDSGLVKPFSFEVPD
jgi:hypothetical protein